MARISFLEKQVMSLRDENEKMRIKVSKDIDKIGKHIHNLPCERERELEHTLRQTEKQLQRETKMRQGLEDNIQGIMLNFKRLHDEAEAARQIVVRKLKELQEREQKLIPLEAANNSHNYRMMRQPIRDNPLVDPQLSGSNVREDPVVDKSHSGYSTRQSPPKRQPKSKKSEVQPSSANSSSFLEDQIRSMRAQQNYIRGHK